MSRGAMRGGRYPMPLGVMRPLPFDMQLAADKFERVQDYDEATLTQDVVTRSNQLTPSEGEKGMVEALQTKVKAQLEKYIAAPDTVPGVKIEEVHEVGSYKKDVALTGHKVADLAVVLSTLPTFELVAALGQKTSDDMRTAGEAVSFVSHDFGGEIKGSTVSVRLLITILPNNANMLEPDLHLPEKLMMVNHLSIQQANWFIQASVQAPHKLLVRVLKDIRKRHAGLQPMSVWVVEYLANFCIANTINHQPLPLGPAFRRFFEILSSGFLLPGAPALFDPIDASFRIGFDISLEDQDRVCSTAQTLLRIICSGPAGHKAVLGLDPKFKDKDLTKEVHVWNGIAISPLESAYFADCMKPIFAETGEEPNAASVKVETEESKEQVMVL